MGRPRTIGTMNGKTKQMVSDAVHERYQALIALLHRQHHERIHQARAQLAFERLQRAYPTLAPKKLWAMAHSSLRMAQGTAHAGYAEPRFMAP